MLGFISGKVISKSLDSYQCIVETQGVGYEIMIPKVQFEAVILQQDISLWIHTHVREDIFSLYGFLAEIDKLCFRTLLSVSGLGPKTALALLGEHGAEKLSQLILNKQTDEISEAPGIGKKLAQRIVLDLSGKMEKLAWISSLPRHTTSMTMAQTPEEPRLKQDLASALQHLGYQPNQVKGVLDKLLQDEANEQSGFEACLRMALKELSGRALSSTSSH